MYSIKQSLLSLLPISLLLHNAAAIVPLFSSCSSSNNYSADDNPFARNLDQLMFQLITGSPCTGYALASNDQGPNKVNGLALCRGDVNSTTCKSCLSNANTQIRQICPYKKEATVWFDECLLRYSDLTFFGEIDDQDQFILANTQNVSTFQSEFNAQVMQLMNSLKMGAYRSPMFFATGTVKIGPSEMLYGLAQCTRDLSSEDCGKCLETVIVEIPSCCGGRKGGRVVGGSCNVRYEIYPFYNA